MPLEGMQLGKYQLVRLIGSGGMGDVYIGEDAHLNRQVAIKVVRSEAATYPDEEAIKGAARLFQREMKAIGRLDHPHILPLYDYGEETLHKTTLIYMVMPFRPEGSLADWLRQRGRAEPLQPKVVAAFVSQASDALQHAHDHQIIHQDVKPSNFLIRSKKGASSTPDLLLADFGIARISSVTASMSQVSRGTPTYMAPEQWNGDPVPATDQYALAIMTFELLTGRPPFRGRPEQIMFHHFSTTPPPPSSLQQSLPASIDAVLLRALAKKPEGRFASIADFADAFQEALPGSGDLHATLAISKAEAAAGTQRQLTLPGGRKVQVSILKDVQDGQLLRLEGLGEPYYTGGPPGALILTLAVSTQEETRPPKNIVSDETVLSGSSPLDETVRASDSPSSGAVDESVPKDNVGIQEGGAPAPFSSETPATPPSPSTTPGTNGDSRPVQKTRQQWIDEGDKFYSTRRYEQALAAYEQGLQVYPDDTVLLLRSKRVRAYIVRLLPSLNQGDGSGESQSASTRRKERSIVWLILWVCIILALFLIINILAGWDPAAIAFTGISGLIGLIFIYGINKT